MSHNSKLARWTARVLTCLLWIAGSAYLIRYEWSMPSPDWVVMATIPVIWAAVIILPILAHSAWQERQFTAFTLLALAAVIGSAYTLSGTISRQGEARDVKVAEAQAANFSKLELTRELDLAIKRQTNANNEADKARSDRRCGRQCQDWELRAKEVGSHIAQLRLQIAGLGADKPVASGEKRIAAALAYIPGVQASSAEIETAVGTFLPSLFGFMLELTTQALGFFGFHPRRKSPEPETPPKARQRNPRELAIEQIRQRTLAGERPTLRVIMDQHHVSKATASRYRAKATG